MDPNWKQPYTMMWSLDVQNQITPSMVFDLGYYGSAGRRPISRGSVQRAGLYQSKQSRVYVVDQRRI
jgi:hypothetical protein